MKFLKGKRRKDVVTEIISNFSGDPSKLEVYKNEQLKDLKNIIDIYQDYYKNLGLLGVGLSIIFSSFTLYVTNIFDTKLSKQVGVVGILVLACYFFKFISDAIHRQNKLSAINKSIDFVLVKRNEIKNIRTTRLEKKYTKR